MKCGVALDFDGWLYMQSSNHKWKNSSKQRKYCGYMVQGTGYRQFSRRQIPVAVQYSYACISVDRAIVLVLRTAFV